MKKLILITIFYLIIGFLLTIFLPTHIEVCLPCSPGYFCNLCEPSFREFIWQDISTIYFWIKVIFWPLNLLLYFVEFTDLGYYFNLKNKISWIRYYFGFRRP